MIIPLAVFFGVEMDWDTYAVLVLAFLFFASLVISFMARWVVRSKFEEGKGAV